MNGSAHELHSTDIIQFHDQRLSLIGWKFESIVGSGESWLTELDTDQLRELLTLRMEMLDE